jgi:hypothetical protein
MIHKELVKKIVLSYKETQYFFINMQIKIVMNIYKYIILIPMIAFGFFACTVKSSDAVAPSSSSSQDLNLHTLPGNNYFASTLGGFTLFLNGSTKQSYEPNTAKYDLTNGLYILTLKSNSNQGAFVSVYFPQIPSDSATLAIESYSSQSTLTGLNAWVTITTLSNGKTWRAIDGKLKILNKNSFLKVNFDSVSVENISAVTDTTVLKASATVYNK